MNFRKIKTNVITILGDASDGRFVTVGYQQQKTSAKEAKGTNRIVRVFYRDGNFPKEKGSLNGPVMHDMDFAIELTVSASAKADVATLNNELSTPAQKAAALVGLKEASEEADKSIDELWEIVYQILMDARNIFLGDDPEVANRWIPRFRKDDTLDDGELVVITGNASLTCSIDEQVTGDTPVPGDKVFDTTMQSNYDDAGDPISDAGVVVDQGPIITDYKTWTNSGYTLLADQNRNTAIYKESERAAYLVGSGAHQNIYKIHLPSFTILLVGTLSFVMNRVQFIWIVDRWVGFNYSTTGGFGTDIARSDGSDLTVWTKDGNAINAGDNWVPFLATDSGGNLRVWLAGGSPEGFAGLMSALVAGDAYLMPGNWTNHGAILGGVVAYGTNFETTATHLYIYGEDKILKGDLTDLSIASSWSTVSTHQYIQSAGIGSVDATGAIYKTAGQSTNAPGAVGGRTDIIQKATDRDSALVAVSGKIYPWKADPMAWFIDHVTKVAYGCGSATDPNQRTVGKSGTTTS